MSDEVRKEDTEQAPIPEEKEKTAAETSETVESAEKKPEEKPSEESGKKDKKEKRKGKRLSKEEEKIEELEDELAKYNDRYLRLCAEYDNFRKRTQKEKESLYGEIRADTLLKFLPVYDNLERALKQGTEDEAYRKGVEMIMTQFCSTMEKLGVEEVPALGEKFDPSLHNAVMHVDDEEKGENEIVDVFQKGFKLGDKVIRFAMVKVAN
ncbi:MAG: nucleotide exchange factor GrpE [Oscillospiraceae bacterium]|nr:nucleotide exchange factor GrpE [Oscillospiraceae bacterium]